MPRRLIGYSALLGPLAGIAIADYWLIRKRQLDVDSLYSMRPDGAYWYKVNKSTSPSRNAPYMTAFNS